MATTIIYTAEYLWIFPHMCDFSETVKNTKESQIEWW